MGMSFKGTPNGWQAMHPGEPLAGPGISDTAQGQTGQWWELHSREVHGSVLCKKKQFMANTQTSLVGLSQYMDKEVIITYSNVPEG